jgi:enoyl-CoA hydratase/carnithine racemase
MNKLVLSENDDLVTLVTLNRPEKLNAVNKDLRLQLTEALRRADAEEKTSVVLLRAAGRSFCVGYDITGGNIDEAWRHDTLKWHEYLRECVAFEMLPWDMKKPVVAAVQGHALGGGCELALLCDLTIAADDAKFGEPEIRFSNAGPAIAMPWLIGLKKARELLYFGDSVDAKTALELGMINRVVPLAELATASLRYAKRLSLISPEALNLTKLSVNRGADIAGFRSALHAGVDVVSPLYAAKTAMGTKFHEIKARDGLSAAVKWRTAQFEE